MSFPTNGLTSPRAVFMQPRQYTIDDRSSKSGFSFELDIKVKLKFRIRIMQTMRNES